MLDYFSVGMWKQVKKSAWFFTCIFFSVSLHAQQMTVTGTITDAETGETLPRVNVLIKGTTTGVISDLDGVYRIQANRGDTLVFSFVGFNPIERVVSSANMDVQLGLNTAQLEEVVVIGYGTTTVKDATGSLTSVGEADFNKGNIVTPESLLNGRVAGLQITQGGEPGAGSVIRIRGGSSLSASNDPLIVINGLPIDNSSASGSRGVLSTINPADIESFTVLKDASATAIYGSRASNGVILITTKQASRKLSVQADVQAGVNTLPNRLDVMDADEFLSFIREYAPEYMDDVADSTGQTNTDWQDVITRTGYYNNINLSLNGTIADVLPVRVSVGRNDQEGIMKNTSFTRNTLNVSLNPAFFEGHLVVSANANFSQEQNQFGNQIGNAISFDPTAPVYDPESPFGGYFQWVNENNDGVFNRNDLRPSAPFNPLAELEQRRDESNVIRKYGNLKLDYNFHNIPELTAVVNLGIDDQRGAGVVEIDSLATPATNSDLVFAGEYNEYTNRRQNLLFDGYLQYDKEVAGNMNLDVTAGYSYQRFTNRSWSLNNSRDVIVPPEENISNDIVLIGLFARANLNVDDKYLFTFAMRRDGTSRFAPDNRWGNFPSAAFAWQIRDDFFPTSAVVSTMKLRLGWGVTGQQDIPVSDVYLSRYSTSQPTSRYIFGSGNNADTVIVGFPQFRNEAIKWEETQTFNVGVDYGFFNDRLNGSVEYFYKQSQDLLANVAISVGSNFSNGGAQNFGDFRIQGLEFALNYDLYNSDDFYWNLNFNFTAIRREISALALGQDIPVGGIAGGVGGTVQLHREGLPPFTFLNYAQVYNEDGFPLEGVFADLNGDNIINQADRYPSAVGFPDYTMGLLSNTSYKGWDLSINMRANVGASIYNNVLSSRAQVLAMRGISTINNAPASIQDFPFQQTSTGLLSDFWLEDGSFLRLDNVTLAYNFNNLIADKISMRASIGGQNILVLTRYSGLDPEVFNEGIDNTIYPRARSWFAGLNFTF